MNQQHDKSMNEQDYSFTPLLAKYAQQKPKDFGDYKERSYPIGAVLDMLKEYAQPILTAAKCDSVEDVVHRLKSIEHLESQVVELLGVTKCGNVLEVVKLFSKPTLTDEELKQYFDNNFDCYADSEDDILNLDYNILKLILKALNKYNVFEEAATALGITSRHLRNLRKDYLIVQDYIEGKYVWVTRTDILNIEKYKHDIQIEK